MTAPCPSGKVAYPSPQAAHSTIAHLTRKTPTGGRRRRKHAEAYRCPDCAAWHVTSTRNRR